jgi:nucleoid-associated protein YgaU
MFFGKKQTGFMNQPPAVNMVNPFGTMAGVPAPGMPYEGYTPEQIAPDGMYSYQTQMGYSCDPYGYCDPCFEYAEIETNKTQPQVYVVQKGDTVYKIAKKFELDWHELAGYNHLDNPDLIYPGERLFIPHRY